MQQKAKWVPQNVSKRWQRCPPSCGGGACVADAMGELWRVGWWPSTPSITRWWTWEAVLWQLRGVALVEGTDGVKHRGAGCGDVDGYTVSKCVFRLFLCIFFLTSIISPIVLFLTQTRWFLRVLPLFWILLRTSAVLYHPVWTMNQDPPTDSIERRLTARRGEDATRPRKCNHECWKGWATFDPAIRTAVSIILRRRFCAWWRDHMFSSVWPTCSRV